MKLRFDSRGIRIGVVAAGWLGLAASGAYGQTLTPLWSVPPDAAGYDLTIGVNQQRGLAYNPATTNLIYGSRTGVGTGIKVKRVDGTTGALLSDLDGTGITGGAAWLGAVAVTEDGVIYVGNITTAPSTSPFKLYRWANEGAVPEVAYSGSLDSAFGRWGDAIAVRGTGANTQVLIGSDSNQVAILATTDMNGAPGSWTAKRLPVIGGTLNFYRSAVAFGAGNTFYGKTGGNSLHRVNFDYEAGTASLATSYPTTGSTGIGGTIAGIAFDPASHLLLGVTRNNTAGVAHTNILYDFFAPANPVRTSSGTFATSNADAAAGISWAAIGGGKAFASVQNNGLVAYTIEMPVTPPAIATQPAGASVLLGGYYSLSVGATGTRPLSFQWLFNGVELTDETNTVLNITDMSAAKAGDYTVRVSNALGQTNSTAAAVTLVPTALTGAMKPLWQVPPGSRTYITSDNNQRGMAYNPASGNVLVVSRTPSNSVHVLDGNTGAHLHSLNMDPTVIGAVGALAINMIGCSDDGQIFVGNVTTDGTVTPFRLYGWLDENPDTVPYLAWQGDPGQGVIGAARWGDSMDVRSTALGIEVLLGSRSGTNVSIIDVAFPGFASVINVSGAPAGSFGLSVSWGTGNTFWGKASGNPILQAEYELDTFTGSVRRSIPGYSAMCVVGVDPVNELLAGVSRETPDNLRLLDLSGSVTELDTEFFPTDRANDFGTGQVEFASGRIFALDSNNGIIAVSVGPKLKMTKVGDALRLIWNGGYTLQATPSLDVGFTNVVGAVSGYEIERSALSGNLFFRLTD